MSAFCAKHFIILVFCIVIYCNAEDLCITTNTRSCSYVANSTDCCNYLKGTFELTAKESLSYIQQIRDIGISHIVLRIICGIIASIAVGFAYLDDDDSFAAFSSGAFCVSMVIVFFLSWSIVGIIDQTGMIQFFEDLETNGCYLSDIDYSPEWFQQQTTTIFALSCTIGILTILFGALLGFAAFRWQEDDDKLTFGISVCCQFVLFILEIVLWIFIFPTYSHWSDMHSSSSNMCYTLIETTDPTPYPTFYPTIPPTTSFPTTSIPTFSPTFAPSTAPTTAPSFNPSTSPTHKPTTPTLIPSFDPTLEPTLYPTYDPTLNPTLIPTLQLLPTFSPTKSPTSSPTDQPTLEPTPAPTLDTAAPTYNPTSPTMSPTESPSMSPTFVSGTDNFYSVNASDNVPLYIVFFGTFFTFFMNLYIFYIDVEENDENLENGQQLQKINKKSGGDNYHLLIENDHDKQLQNQGGYSGYSGYSAPPPPIGSVNYDKQNKNDNNDNKDDKADDNNDNDNDGKDDNKQNENDTDIDNKDESKSNDVKKSCCGRMLNCFKRFLTTQKKSITWVIVIYQVASLIYTFVYSLILAMNAAPDPDPFTWNNYQCATKAFAISSHYKNTLATVFVLMTKDYLYQKNNHVIDNVGDYLMNVVRKNWSSKKKEEKKSISLINDNDDQSISYSPSINDNIVINKAKPKTTQKYHSSVVIYLGFVAMSVAFYVLSFATTHLLVGVVVFLPIILVCGLFLSIIYCFLRKFTIDQYEGDPAFQRDIFMFIGGLMCAFCVVLGVMVTECMIIFYDNPQLYTTAISAVMTERTSSSYWESLFFYKIINFVAMLL